MDEAVRKFKADQAAAQRRADQFARAMGYRDAEEAMASYREAIEMAENDKIRKAIRHDWAQMKLKARRELGEIP